MKLTLKHQLKFYLEKKQIKAAELSRRTGVPKSSISDWLSGMQPKNLENLREVAGFFETSVDNLLFGNGLERKESFKDISEMIPDEWFGGKFEVKFRRIK